MHRRDVHHKRFREIHLNQSTSGIRRGASMSKGGGRHVRIHCLLVSDPFLVVEFSVLPRVG